MQESRSTPQTGELLSPEPVSRRALVLLSGGLDSQLAVCVLREQDIEVHGVVFDSPFFTPDTARKAARQLDIPLHVLPFTKDIVDLVNSPRHGFGGCMNPCIDCHARMIRRAGELMEDMKFDFVATGEVLNERPMSQNRRSLGLVARDSGYAEVLLRPLSAKLLDETLPERNGWVDRDRLLDLEGRGRKRQFALAENYGLKEYPTPAGGCRLTEPNFSLRLRDLKEHEGLQGEHALRLLRVGRHFRLNDRIKVIVGRNEADNTQLEGTAELYDYLLKVDGFPGPTALMPCTAHEDDVLRGAALCARYSDCPPADPVLVRVRSARGIREIRVQPLSNEQAEALRI